MKRYVNADDVLPQPLIRQIQQHVHSRYLWIPTTRRDERIERNAYILQCYEEGVDVDEIATTVGLARRTVFHILREARLCSAPPHRGPHRPA